MSIIVLSLDNGSQKELAAVVESLGLGASASAVNQAMGLFGVDELRFDFETYAAQSSFINGWRNVLDAWKQLNDATQIVSCAIVLFRLRSVVDEKKVAGMHIGKTRNEAGIRAFGACFFHGRQLMNNRAMRNEARLAIDESFRLADFVDDKALTESRLKKFRGQLGVGQLFFARGQRTLKPVALLSSALRNLEISRRCGDHTPNHYSYELEVIGRLLSIEYSRGLAEKGRAITETVPLSIHQQAYSAGDFYLTCAIHQAEHGDIPLEEISAQFDTAIAYYDSGISLCADAKQNIAKFRAKKGYAELRKSTSTRTPLSLEAYTSIIEDLSHGAPDFHTGFSPLPTALFWRAQLHKKNQDYDSAIADLTRALNMPAPAKADPTILQQIARIKLELCSCRLEAAIQSECQGDVVTYYKQMLDFDASLSPSIPMLASAIKFISESAPSATNPLMIRAGLKLMIATRNETSREDKDRAFGSSYIAGAMLRLKQYLKTDDLKTICQLYSEAEFLADEKPAPELLGLAAGAKLALAKRLKLDGDSTSTPRDLLIESCDYFERSLQHVDHSSSEFSVMTGKSKLGEACLRLHAYTHDTLDLNRSIENLEDSRKLGNNEPELLGLLGDGYYRRGQQNKSVADLERAASLKAQALKFALDGGSYAVSKRENYSLSSKINFGLWRLGNDEEKLASAVSLVIAAIGEDPSWPWPFFQLAEYLEEIAPQAIGRVPEPKAGSFVTEIWNAVEDRDIERINFLGATAAAESTEFSVDILGGRRRSVYVLDDPHRLLNSSIVLKVGKKEDVERDSDSTLDFRRYLSANDAPRSFRLPQLKGVIERDNESVRRHIIWNNLRPDLKEDLAHLVQDIKRRICGIASAGSPSFSV